MEIDLNMPVWQLTVGQLLDIIIQHMGNNTATTVIDTTKSDKYVYRLAGIAELFGCSKKTASRLKQSGKIDGAIVQVGHLIVVDADKALELAGRKKKHYSRIKSD